MAVREVIFRAKRKDNGEWVYGVPLKEGYSQEVEMLWYEYSSLAYTERVQVLPETVGQFVGLTDKNGKKIWEGDIVRWDGDEISIIRYCEGVYRLCNAEGYYGVSLHNHFSYVEVIGNIHDNPELLEVK